MACKRSAVRSRVAPPKSPRDFQEFQNFSFKSIFSLFMLKNKLAYLCFCPVLSGCSMFAFESNVDPDNFISYFELSKVKRYSNKELSVLNYEDVGTVDGISSQFTEKDPEPTEKDAKAEARREAVKKGGNGMVYSTCITLEDTPVCTRSISCYARVVIVKED